MGICQVLEEKMRSFKESIPLFADLKNDALRERYVHIARGVACYYGNMGGVASYNVVLKCCGWCLGVDYL